MEATEDNSNIFREGSSGLQNKKETGTVQDDLEDLIGSPFKLKGKCGSLKSKPLCERDLKREELWTSVVNDWINRDKVPFRNGKIAKKYGIRKKTVWEILKKFKERGEVRVHRATGRKLSEGWESWLEFKEILEQEPTLTSGEMAKRLDLSPYIARRMMIEYRNGALNPVECQSSKELQGTSASSSVTATAQEDNDDNNDCGWEGDEDDLQENVNRAPCFICDAVDKNVLDSTFPCGGVTPSVPAEVERSERVIWFLKDVLEMRDDDLVNVMKEARGRNPDSWEISVCTDPECEGAVERSFALWKEIKKLEGELKKCRKGILERIRSRCSTGKGTAGVSVEVDQAWLNARVQERVKRGLPEADSIEFQGPGEPQVKVEPKEEEFDDLDDFTGFEALGNDNEWDVKDLKVEVNEENANSSNCRRSSRMKRQTAKFKYDKLGSGANSRAGSGTGPKGKSKLKGAKSKKEENKEDETAVRFGEKMYSCQGCPSLEEMDKDKFIAHLAFHSSYPYKCTGCNFHFPEGAESEQVQKHWEERHPGSQSDSPKVFRVPSSMAAGNIWICSGRKCKELFGSVSERDGHELLVHGISEPKAKFRCSTCSSQFRDMTELRFHRAIEHPKDAMLSCCYCSIQFEINSGKNDIKFLNLDQLKKHIPQKHPDQMFLNAQGEPTRNMRFLQTCPICGLVFNFLNYSKLDYHIYRDHGHKLHETYTCPVCSRKMRYAKAWEHTKLRHWPDSPVRFPCRFCGKPFRKTFNRNEHEQIHKNKDTRPYQCDICGSSFAVRQYLRIHKRVTHERRLFPSALKKKQQSRKSATEVPSNSSESSMKVTENVIMEPSHQSERFVGPPVAPLLHQDLQYSSWDVSSAPQY